MSNVQNYGPNGRDTVFLLDDRPEVIDTTTSYFESNGVKTLSADNVDDAWSRLSAEEKSVKIALIDKNLYQDREGGIRFIEEAKKRFPKVVFFLMTGWTLRQPEKDYINSRNLNWLDKGTLAPENLLALFNEPGVQGLRGGMSSMNAGGLSQVVPSEKENMLKTSLRDETIQSLRSENANLRSAVHAMAQDLVRRLQDDQFSSEEPAIFLDSRELSVEDLIAEVEGCTPLGLKMLELHFDVIDDLLKDRQKKRKWSWLRRRNRGLR